MSDEFLALEAVKEFVNELWDAYGSKKTSPLALYKRLLDHIKDGEKNVGLEKCLNGFRSFFRKHIKAIFDKETMMKELPLGTIIVFGTNERVCIEIQKFLYRAGPEDRETLRQHLLTIYAILDPNEESLSKLQNPSTPLEALGIDEGTNEGKFVSDIVEKVKGSMDGVDTDDPQAAIAGFMASGAFSDIIGGLTKGVESGNINPEKMLAGMQGMIGNMGGAEAGAALASASKVVEEE